MNTNGCAYVLQIPRSGRNGGLFDGRLGRHVAVSVGGGLFLAAAAALVRHTIHHDRLSAAVGDRGGCGDDGLGRRRFDGVNLEGGQNLQERDPMEYS